MSITVTGATASPPTIAPGGGQSTVTPQMLDPDQTFSLVIQADGTRTVLAILIHEPEVYSVNPADIGVTGKVVATPLDAASAALATVAVGPGGTFVITAK